MSLAFLDMDLPHFVLLLVFAIPLTAVVGGLLLEALKVIRGERKGDGKGYSADETRIMQELYKGMSRLEERVEALETLLLNERDTGARSDAAARRMEQ